MKTSEIVIMAAGAFAILLGILAAAGTGGLALATGIPELLIIGGLGAFGVGAGKIV